MRLLGANKPAQASYQAAEALFSTQNDRMPSISDASPGSLYAYVLLPLGINAYRCLSSRFVFSAVPQRSNPTPIRLGPTPASLLFLEFLLLPLPFDQHRKEVP